MKVTVLSAVPIDPAEPSALAPAPNVTETEYIWNLLRQDQTPPITDLFAAPIEVLTNYRGHMLYCAGGVGVHRIDPKTDGGNGMMCLPPPGMEEDAIVSSPQGRFRARVRLE